jgi:hypothetical protein
MKGRERFSLGAGKLRANIILGLAPSAYLHFERHATYFFDSHAMAVAARLKSVVMIARPLRSQNFRWQDFRVIALVLCAWFSWLVHPALAQNARLSEDNADSIAVVIGNKNYRQTVSVDFAHNDADAMRDFLIRSLGFRGSNIFVLKDATFIDFYEMFGNERSPSGRLWDAVKHGRANVFVYFSGHWVPDLQTRQPFLLPSDGDPRQAERGFPLDTLYRNLEQVKRKVGPNGQVIVMIDACFTGETGRRGESLLAVSAPGFVLARPRTGSGVVKLLATSAASPANWDQENKLGLFASRFLLGAAGLARVSEAKPDLSWAELRRFVIDSVAEGARRETGREQVPEIDEAALTLKPDGPVPAIEHAYGCIRDETRGEAPGRWNRRLRIWVTTRSVPVRDREIPQKPQVHFRCILS